MKNILLYISVGFIFYFGLSDSLLKSQKIDCASGSNVACSYLEVGNKL